MLLAVAKPCKADCTRTIVSITDNSSTTDGLLIDRGFAEAEEGAEGRVAEEEEADMEPPCFERGQLTEARAVQKCFMSDGLIREKRYAMRPMTTARRLTHDDSLCRWAVERERGQGRGVRVLERKGNNAARKEGRQLGSLTLVRV